MATHGCREFQFGAGPSLGEPNPPPQLPARGTGVLSGQMTVSPPDGGHRALTVTRLLRLQTSCSFDYAFCRSYNSADLKGTPHPPIPQYPFGFFARYCW